MDRASKGVEEFLEGCQMLLLSAITLSTFLPIHDGVSKFLNTIFTCLAQNGTFSK